ncbi:hypothetical protein DL89DRAFT_269834 [Linderina pennispora]|uniref:Phospholipid/glycerol acyltransferase domain-containing protein n=1 Tax=Linderina pennispora TaxID=61395 RepID=A0A1Y1VZV1_9FUNG|nr:uncharacterized protein DL89DRAFT_269834 [Linderina pennispora]ORX66790.1 hypothetical protein DL89DRAFT_269834 [Linderina pennispora]
MRLAQGLKSFRPVLGATALLDALTASMGVLIVVPGLRRPATLFLQMRTVSLQRGRRNTQEAHVSSGDIIVANHASYLDNATCYARRISLYQALRAPAQMTPALLPANEAEPLKTITEQARVRQTGPVVLLPVTKIHVLALKYPFSAFSPAYSVGSQLMHVFQLCCQIVLAAGEAPRMADSALLRWILDERVQECLVGVSRLRMTKMTAMDKRDFLKFYNAQK